MRLFSVGLVVLGLAASTFLAGCSTTCTLIGCPGQVRIIGTSSTLFEAGRYRATVFAKDRELSLLVDFDESPNSIGYGELCGEAFCIGMSVDEEGVGVFANSHSAAEPIGSIRVEFEFDGELLGSIKQAPVYENEYPNGEDCIACPTSTIMLSFD